ncbi:MAG: DivIVA domain-containing protein [Erysipelothrix sp.]|nr:DivIVA domain-containing protein [Erysipelothrix sp.]
MNDKLKQNPESILNKRFNVDFKGYSPLEVDSFLDDVMHDYAHYESLIATLVNKVELLEESLHLYQQKLLESNTTIAALKDSENAPPSDVLKRLARLESLLEKK